MFVTFEVTQTDKLTEALGASEYAVHACDVRRNPLAEGQFKIWSLLTMPAPIMSGRWALLHGLHPFPPHPFPYREVGRVEETIKALGAADHAGKVPNVLPIWIRQKSTVCQTGGWFQRRQSRGAKHH